jgi:hypothetical protein
MPRPLAINVKDCITRQHPALQRYQRIDTRTPAIITAC